MRAMARSSQFVRQRWGGSRPSCRCGTQRVHHSAWSALCADLHTVAEEEEWPAYILRYVLQLLVVRGAAKALLMADALREYVSALATVRSFGVYDQRADVNRFVFPNRNVDIIETRSRD